jgi:hypothetical protein
VRIFKNKAFTRFSDKAGVTDADLCKAIANAERGLIDADLGGGVVKQRIPRSGSGKSGGFRTIILFRAGTDAFFVYGFAKNERANISDDELAAFRLLAKTMMAFKAEDIAKAVSNETLIEVICHEKTIS